MEKMYKSNEKYAIQHYLPVMILTVPYYISMPSYYTSSYSCYETLREPRSLTLLTSQPGVLSGFGRGL